MSKFLKILKYVFTLGVGLYLDYKKEKSKTRVLIQNISDLLIEAKTAKDMVKIGAKSEAIQLMLDPENLKRMLSTYQESKGLLDDIKADVGAFKLENKGV